MKKLVQVALAFCCLVVVSSTNYGAFAQKPEEKLGWKLGSQAYTFRLFTFFEAVDKIKSAGLGYVEAFPGQNIGGGIEGKMDFNMPAEKRNQILKKLKDSGVKMMSYGVISPRTEEEWRQLFVFVKAMGAENITTEPSPEFIPLISKLADEHKINVAIHNHPEPSRYWHPDVVLEALKGQSKRLGACADIGHWVRSGLDPVESLRKLEGRIVQLHFKDLNEKNNKKAHDVHWGTGVNNIDGVLAELKRQKFKGLFSVEYEYNWENNLPDVTASVAYFREAAKKLR